MVNLTDYRQHKSYDNLWLILRNIDNTKGQDNLWLILRNIDNTKVMTIYG